MHKIFTFIILALLMTSQSSCFRNFYNTESARIVTEKEILTLTDATKSVIIHFSDMPMMARQVAVNDSVLAGTVEPIWKETGTNITPSFETGSHPFKIKYKEQITTQVHVFTVGQLHPKDGKLNLPIKSITQVQTYPYNVGLSIASHVGGAAIIVGGILAAYGLIAFGSLFAWLFSL
jgi:hypothetical protein